MRKALYILSQLTDADVEWLVSAGRRRSLQPGEVLIHEGRAADALSFVLDGSLAVDMGGQVIARLGVGEVVGEMSFVDADPPSASVRAEQPSVVLCVERAEISRALEHDPALAARFYRALATFLSSRLRAANRRAAAGGSLEDGEELDTGLLDTVHLAGARFEHLLHRLLDR